VNNFGKQGRNEMLLCSRTIETWLSKANVSATACFKYPESMVDEQRLANQRRVIINHNLLTQVELKELQRNTVEQPAQSVESNTVADQQQPNILTKP
jgi:hypothetical protein